MIRFIFALFLLSSVLTADDKITSILSKLPNAHTSPPKINKLSGGLTNDNYTASFGQTTYFIRCSKGQNELLGSSLKNEWQCTSLAASCGLAPKVIAYKESDAIMVTDFITPSDRKVDLRNPNTLQHLCTLIHSLHNLKEKFPRQFCPFKTVASYVKTARKVSAKLPSSLFSMVLPKVKQMKKNHKPLHKAVPCHLDLHHDNVIDDGSRLWLIDWEYSAMADPFFDIATLASTEFFSENEMKELLKTYLKGKLPSQKEITHLYKMRALAELRWSLWCYIQAKISPLDQPFAEYGDLFLRNCMHYLSLV
jgi:thiamine kinase-like enzyme